MLPSPWTAFPFLKGLVVAAPAVAAIYGRIDRNDTSVGRSQKSTRVALFYLAGIVSIFGTWVWAYGHFRPRQHQTLAAPYVYPKSCPAKNYVVEGDVPSSCADPKYRVDAYALGIDQYGNGKGRWYRIGNDAFELLCPNNRTDTCQNLTYAKDMFIQHGVPKII